MEKGKSGCQMSYEKADKHNECLTTIKQLVVEKEISANQAAREIQNLGYSFDEAWAMLLKHDLPPKIVRLR